jgi:3-phosphoshikimate 1-carboxyvinyltransferase
MKSRPILPLVDALRSLGANIEYMEKQDYPPLRITGNSEICKTQNAVAEIDAGVSSQFVSALMMIAPLFSTGLHISMICTNKVSVPYIQMTASLMRSCGVRVEFIDNNNIFAEGRYTAPEHVYVESDWSSASYLYAILALSEHGGSLRLPHLYEDSVQGDKIVAEWFEDFGIETVFNDDGAVITSTGSEGISRAPRFYDFTHHPDIAQTIAVVCAGLGLEACISGIHSLRHKETDRISAVCNELTRLGAKLEYNAEEDEMHIFEGGFNGEINHETIRTYGDHRMAMAFASLAARYAPVSIENPSVVSKSFPNFWQLFHENL